MTPQQIRTLLGELVVACQRLVPQDDVTLVELFNALPAEMRQWMLNNAITDLEDLTAQTQCQADERLRKITEALDGFRQVTDPSGTPIPTAEDGLDADAVFTGPKLVEDA